jgi:hypothetical protein
LTQRGFRYARFWRNFLAIVIAHKIGVPRGWLAIKAGPIQQLLKCAEDSVRWIGLTGERGSPATRPRPSKPEKRASENRDWVDWQPCCAVHSRGCHGQQEAVPARLRADGR